MRAPQEMRPTPRALELATPIGEALQNLRFALARPQQDFVAETSTRLFTVAASDNCDFALAPAIGRLRKLAPNVGFDIVGSARSAALDRIDEGMFDIVLGRLDHIPQRYFSTPLYEERCVFVYNRDVHNFDNGLSVEAFAALPHLHVVRDTTDFVDGALAEEGLARRRVMTVPYFALVPYLLEHSDLIAVVGARIAQRFVALPWIGTRELPMGCAPWTISAVWGKAQDGDRGVAWLCSQLQEAGAALEARPS